MTHCVPVTSQFREVKDAHTVPINLSMAESTGALQPMLSAIHGR